MRMVKEEGEMDEADEEFWIAQLEMMLLSASLPRCAAALIDMGLC